MKACYESRATEALTGGFLDCQLRRSVFLGLAFARHRLQIRCDISGRILEEILVVWAGQARVGSP